MPASAGGAAALLGASGGPAVVAAGYWFALEPVLLNSAVLVGLGWLFHRTSRHSYPHRVMPLPLAPAQAVDIVAADVDRALADLGEGLDIDRQDLEALVRRVQVHANERQRAMSKVSNSL